MPDSVPVDTVTGSQYFRINPHINSDDNGGVIIAWADARNGNGNNVYAQRINSSGVIQWGT